MSYRFHLPLDRRDELPFFLERRMREWLDSVDSQHNYDYELHSIRFIGGSLLDEITREDERWNDIWANKCEGVWDKCTIVHTASWRFIQHQQVECRDIGFKDEVGHTQYINTYSIESTVFEILDDMLAIQFRFMFDVKAENE